MDERRAVGRVASSASDDAAVLVVIVTVRPPDGVLELCVRTLLDTDPGAVAPFEVLVVDNGGRKR